MAGSTTASNSHILVLKNMASSMRDMKTKIMDSEAKVKDIDALKETVQKLEQLYAVTRRITSAKIHTMTNSSEAALPSFTRICDELIRLTWSYSHNPTNGAYRHKIARLSKDIAPKLALRSFICLASVPNQQLAEQIAQDLAPFTGHTNRSTSYVTPARISALKRGMLHKTTNIALEYRSLIGFLCSACNVLADTGKEIYVTDQHVVRVVDAQLRKEWDTHLADMMKPEDWTSNERLLFCGIKGSRKRPYTFEEYCINGFRVGSAQGFPDPDKFKCVEREMAVVCRCKHCWESLN